MPHLLAILLAGWAAATGNTYVNGRISRSMSGTVEIYEPMLRINEWVHPWASGASVSGQPVSGQVSRGGNYINFFGSGLDASATEYGNGFSVNATIRKSGKPPLLLSFTIQAMGPTNDPNRPPSLSVFDSHASLRLNPSAGGRDYDLSGWVDPERFGSEGVALVGIVAAMAMDKRAASASENSSRTPSQRVQSLVTSSYLP